MNRCSKNIYKLINVYRTKAFIVFPFIILCTVCATNSELWQGVITAKYFYFACAVSISVAGIAIWHIRCRQQTPVIRYTDVAVSIFFVYVIIHQLVSGGISGVKWNLFLLMLPLYFFVRTFTMQPASVVLLTYCFILLTLVESIWGIMQWYSLIPLYHNRFPVTGSLFNPGPYAGFIAIGIPLLFSVWLKTPIFRNQSEKL